MKRKSKSRDGAHAYKSTTCEPKVSTNDRCDRPIDQETQAICPYEWIKPGVAMFVRNGNKNFEHPAKALSAPYLAGCYSSDDESNSKTSKPSVGQEWRNEWHVKLRWESHRFTGFVQCRKCRPMFESSEADSDDEDARSSRRSARRRGKQVNYCEVNLKSAAVGDDVSPGPRLRSSRLETRAQPLKQPVLKQIAVPGRKNGVFFVRRSAPKTCSAMEALDKDQSSSDMDRPLRRCETQTSVRLESSTAAKEKHVRLESSTAAKEKHAETGREDVPNEKTDDKAEVKTTENETSLPTADSSNNLSSKHDEQKPSLVPSACFVQTQTCFNSPSQEAYESDSASAAPRGDNGVYKEELTYDVFVVPRTKIIKTSASCHQEDEDETAYLSKSSVSKPMFVRSSQHPAKVRRPGEPQHVVKKRRIESGDTSLHSQSASSEAVLLGPSVTLEEDDFKHRQQHNNQRNTSFVGQEDGEDEDIVAKDPGATLRCCERNRHTVNNETTTSAASWLPSYDGARCFPLNVNSLCTDALRETYSESELRAVMTLSLARVINQNSGIRR